MGCDIHVHTEVLINGTWEHLGHPRIDRWYALFGKMAGVRDKSQTPLAHLRGIPDDATTLTKIDFARWGGDAHSASYLENEEIVLLSRWWDEQKGEKCNPIESQFGFVLGCSWDDPPESVTAMRWVFWFDS